MKQSSMPGPPQGELLCVQTPPARQVSLKVPQLPPTATQPPVLVELLVQQAGPTQMLPSQHGSPGAPQLLHVVVAPVEEQTWFGAVQSLPLVVPDPPQQGWPDPPQVPQPPKEASEHFPVSGGAQAAPGAVQVPFTQQAPPPQVWSSQQG
jgi:hypothetical protein